MAGDVRPYLLLAAAVQNSWPPGPCSLGGTGGGDGGRKGAKEQQKVSPGSPSPLSSFPPFFGPAVVLGRVVG